MGRDGEFKRAPLLPCPLAVLRRENCEAPAEINRCVLHSSTHFYPHRTALSTCHLLLLLFLSNLVVQWKQLPSLSSSTPTYLQCPNLNEGKAAAAAVPKLSAFPYLSCSPSYLYLQPCHLGNGWGWAAAAPIPSPLPFLLSHHSKVARKRSFSENGLNLQI